VDPECIDEVERAVARINWSMVTTLGYTGGI
jgi:hypothetical protein